MNDVTPLELERQARQWILSEHTALIAAVREAAATVAEARNGKSGSLTSSPRDAVARELVDRGLMARFPAVLLDLARATDLEPAARLVAAPPYVSINGTAVILRLPVPEFRLVVSIRTFRIDRRPTRYRFFTAEPTESVGVSVRTRP